jgi:hypothetical protein
VDASLAPEPRPSGEFQGGRIVGGRLADRHAHASPMPNNAPAPDGQQGLRLTPARTWLCATYPPRCSWGSVSTPGRWW